MGNVRLAAIAALVGFACGESDHNKRDAGTGEVDAPEILPDGSTTSDGNTVTDAGIDVPDADLNDHTAPTIMTTAPGGGAAGVWLHDRFAVTFSEAILPSSVTTSTLRLIDPSNQNISGEVAVNGAVAYVRAIDTAAFVGPLRLEVDAAIADLAGNALGATATYTWTLDAWAKPSPVIATAMEFPRVGVAIADTVWVVTGNNGALSVLDANGQALGALAVTNATAPVITGPGPVVAWQEGSTIQAARWNGSAWLSLPSPGTGRLPALAASPSGVVGISWVDANNDIASARLVSDSWQAGTPLSATTVLDVSLAMPDDTTLVVGFLDRNVNGDQVRVATLGISELPALTLTAPAVDPQNHVSVAARSGAIAVAWDEWSRHSYSGHVAVATATGWNVLPTIDVDPPGNTLQPVVQLDTTNTPVVAWYERIEGANRGYVAQWSGSAWVTIGGNAWTGAALPKSLSFKLWRDRVPVVAWRNNVNTDIELARYNGPAQSFGISARGSLAGCSFDPANPPATLMATGCFTIVAGVATPHPGLVPYDLIAELWSDGALKRRWLGLASGALTASSNGSLDAPVGSFIIKEFAIGDPGARTIMETRFLTRTATGWQGVSYRWRFNGSDADLLSGNSTLTVTWGTHDHIYPSRAQCQRCHNSSVGQLLGVRPEQLARRFDYSGVLDDQLRVLNQIGVYVNAGATPYPAPHDPRETLEHRMRAYIATNCAHCHNPAGERNQQDFRFATLLGNTGLCALIAPGDPAGSRLYQKDASRPGMPPIATDLVDPFVADVEAQWIRSMMTCQ